MVAKPRLWNRAPFIRLLLPFMAGIAAQWYCQFSIRLLLTLSITSFIIFLAGQFLPVAKRFAFSVAQGMVLSILFVLAGALLVWAKDAQHQQNWIGGFTGSSYITQLKIEEPLVEKTASFKAVARVQGVQSAGKMIRASGRVLLYFKKDSSVSPIVYGSQILLLKPLQEIKNSGNPGAFDFKRYSLFGGITHQVYITQDDFVLLSNNEKSDFKNFLFKSRAFIINVLRKYIKGDKEQGLAEALLIGYKDDLDKTLVQSYSNTGVVHVIAISGLHLGIIYWILLLLTRPLNDKKLAPLRLFLILSGLWAFSFLAGAQPSVLRSAVMFSAIAWSVVVNRKSAIYNTMALSAFLLLWYNPYWLWDVGFQLSYTAVLSIIIFFKPIYSWFYFPNKAIDFFWKLAAASLAAQLLTLPISIYYFHQFPLLFLIANLFAVPLSSLILVGEILLCLLFFISPVAGALGRLLQWMIGVMNSAVENLDTLPFAVWNGLSISVLQTALLYLIIAAAGYWLLERSTRAVRIALAACMVFLLLRQTAFIAAANQNKIIVYNVPKYSAIDLISGRHYSFLGDSALEQNDFLRNFHIQPSRIMHRVRPKAGVAVSNSFLFRGKQILLIDRPVRFKPAQVKPVVHLLVLARNPKIDITLLAETFSIRQVVIDGSVPPWKAKLWKKRCDSLRILCYDVAEKGAFVMKL